MAKSSRFRETFIMMHPAREPDCIFSERDVVELEEGFFVLNDDLHQMQLATREQIDLAREKWTVKISWLKVRSHLQQTKEVKGPLSVDPTARLFSPQAPRFTRCAAEQYGVLEPMYLSSTVNNFRWKTQPTGCREQVSLNLNSFREL